jgi:hypothetical protein
MPTLAGMKALPCIAVLGAMAICGCPKFKSSDIAGVYISTSSRGVSTSGKIVLDLRKDGTAKRDWKINLGSSVLAMVTTGTWSIAGDELVVEGQHTTTTTHSEMLAAGGVSPLEDVSDTKTRNTFSIEGNGDLINRETGDRYIKSR